MLSYIWTASLILTFCALGMMSFLVIRRVIDERGQASGTNGRQELQSALIRFTQDRDRTAVLATLARTPKAIIAESGFELLSLLRGEDRMLIEEVFAEADLPAYIRQQLVKANEAERIHACEILVAFPSEKTTSELVKALDDRSGNVSVAAAIALTQLDELPPLDFVLDKIGHYAQRSRRLIELFQNFPEHRIEELRNYAADIRGVPFVRAGALNALSSTGDYGLLRLFDQCAADESHEVVASAIRALGRIAHPASTRTVLLALSSDDWQVRTEAAEAAGRIGAPEAIEPLSRLLSDNDWSVRFEAGRSLRILGEDGLDTLSRIAAGEPSRSQRTASLVLAEAQT